MGLGLVGLLMAGAHVRHGGLYYDDWAVLALGRFPPPGGLLHGLWLDYGQRPGQVLYYLALDRAVGFDPAVRLGIAIGMAVLQATCLYALLRRVGLAARDGAAIAALSLSLPFSDSVWLWGILSLTTLAIVAWLVGMMLALAAFEQRGRRAIALHAASLSLYVLSLLSYEVFAVAGCVGGLLYVRVAGFARARRRWALDIAVIVASLVLARVLLPIDVATPSHTQSLAGMAAHGALLARAGLRLLGAAVLPFAGISPWFGVGVLAVGLLGALAFRAAAAHPSPARGEVGRWLVLASAGALLAISAWAVYLPASDHYSPAALGTVNRVNAAAAIGVAIVVYSLLVLVAHVSTQVLGLRASIAPAAAILATIALGVAYVTRSASDARAWDAAARDQRALLAHVHSAMPTPPDGATVYVFDAPERVGPGVPVLNTTLDLTSALRISYSSPTLTGVPVPSTPALGCGPRGPFAGGVSSIYRSSYIVDAAARRAAPLLSRRQCLSLTAGPFAGGYRVAELWRSASRGRG